MCETRHRQGLASGEWSPEREDYTWLETAFCEEFLKPLAWFGGMEYEWRSGANPAQAGFWVLLWSKDPRRLWWELRDELERQARARAAEGGCKTEDRNPKSEGREPPPDLAAVLKGWTAGTGKAGYTRPLMIRNIIFDWSGTLVDDLPAVWKATNYVLAQAERPEMTLEQFRAEFCLPFTIFYDRHTPHVPLPQLEDWFHSRFRQVQDSVCALPHAREFLEFCRGSKLRTFLLSTVHRDHFAVQAAITGFGAFLDKPYLNVWDKREKIHEILEENGLVPDETLFIGDMQHDIETARHGGIHSCAVLTGYNTLEQLRAAEPDLIVEHLGELREVLRAERPAPQTAGETIRGEPSAHRDGRRLDFQRRRASADDSHAQMVESLGHSRRQDQVGRDFRRGVAPRDQGGDRTWR